MKRQYKLFQFGGLNRSLPAHEIPLNYTPDCNGVWPIYGRIARIYGKEKNASTQLDGTGILKQHIFIDSSQNEYNLAITNTKTYKETSGTYTSIQGSTDFTSTIDVVACVNHFDSTGTEIAVISNLTDGMKKWTGTGNIDDLDGSPPKAKILLPFRGYLLAFYVNESGTTDPRKCRYSALFNGESWDAGNYFYLKQSSDPIIAAELLRDRTVIYKEKSISLLDYIGGTLVFDLIENYINGIGPASINSVASWGESGERHYILGQDTKIYLFDGIDHFHISREIDLILSTINPSYKNHISCITAPTVGKIIWAVPLGDDTSCKTLIIYDVFDKSWWIKDDEAVAITSFGKSKLESTLTWEDLPYSTWEEWDQAQWDSRESVANAPNILTGNTDGYVRRFVDGVDDDGTDITSHYLSAFDNIDGSEWTVKTVNKIYLEIKNRGSGTLTLEIFTNNNSDEAILVNEDQDLYKIIPLYSSNTNKAYIVYEVDVNVDCFNIAIKLSRSAGAWSAKVRGYDYEIMADRVLEEAESESSGDALTFGTEELTFGTDELTF